MMGCVSHSVLMSCISCHIFSLVTTSETAVKLLKESTVENPATRARIIMLVICYAQTEVA